MVKAGGNKEKEGGSLSDAATQFTLNPGNYELGSTESLAAARSLVEAKKTPRGTIQIVLVSPDSTRENGPLIEILPD